MEKPENHLNDLIRLVPEFPVLIDVIQKLLESDPDLVEREDEDLRTPLMVALVYPNIELIKLLLEKRAEPQTSDYSGNNALMVAYKYGQNVTPGNISELANLGVDINAENTSGYNLLMEVFRGDHESKVEIVEAILKSGANVNAQDKMGRTALMYSVMEENSSRKIFKMLLKADARIYITDSEGKDVFNHFRADFNMGKILTKMTIGTGKKF